MTAYYRVMLGRQSAFVDECVSGGYIGASYDLDRDLSMALVGERRQFTDLVIPMLLEKDPSRGRVSAGFACGTLWTVCKGMNEGDVILSPTGRGMYHVGAVSGPYWYQEAAELPHSRPVQWRPDLIARADLSPELQASTRRPMTVVDVSSFSGEIKKLLGDGPKDGTVLDPTVEDPSAFALEKHLEDFLVANWASTELGRGYRIYEVDGERVGQQYPTDTGPIDILAMSHDRSQLLVVELKRGRASDAVVGQIQRYMGYVTEVLAEPNQTVRGVIIAFEDDLRVRRALAVAPNIDFYRYEVHFHLKPVRPGASPPECPKRIAHMPALRHEP